MPLGYARFRPSINVVADERVPVPAGADVVRHIAVVQPDRALSDALLLELAFLAELDVTQFLVHMRIMELGCLGC
jgi:hypothetical protein